MARATDGNEQLLCSFCGKSQRQVKKLIAGPGVYICDECIDLCNEIIDEELTGTSSFDLENLPKPKEIYSVLQEYVVGEDVENILLKLIQAADFDVKKAETGIIYIDEVDKIARKADNPSITRDVSGESVQQALLKILEGTVASVPPQGGRKHPHQDFLQINTKNVLFICGGAFGGLEEVIRQRIGKRSIGFSGDVDARLEEESDEILQNVQPEDLLKYGLIPEFVGRLPVISTLRSLNEEDLVRILTEPKNALVKQYRQFFRYDKVDLTFSDEALKAVAEQALERGTGARGLRSILETALLPTMYELPSRSDVAKCVVDADTVRDGVQPTLVTASERSKYAYDEETA